MEEISIGFIIICLISGFVIGFVSWLFDDPRILGLFQIGGIVGAYVFLMSLIPSSTVSTAAQINTTQFVNSTTDMVYFLIYYAVGDAAGSVGSLFFRRIS